MLSSGCHYFWRNDLFQPPFRLPLGVILFGAMRARSLCAEDYQHGAKERVGWAAELFPPLRLEMLDDPELEGIW